MDEFDVLDKLIVLVIQFRYQLVVFVHIHGYIWLAEGCLWYLLPRQNLRWHLLPGGMWHLLQRSAARAYLAPI